MLSPARALNARCTKGKPAKKSLFAGSRRRRTHCSLVFSAKSVSSGYGRKRPGRRCKRRFARNCARSLHYGSIQQQPYDIVENLRTPQPEALHLVDAMRAKPAQRFSPLHVFGQCRQPQCPSQRNGRRVNKSVACIELTIAREGQVDPEPPDQQSLEAGEAEIDDSEVINRQSHAEACRSPHPRLAHGLRSRPGRAARRT